MNRWKLTEEIKDTIKPLVREWLDKVESVECANEIALDLSGMNINPSQLEELMEGFGYEKTSMERNGWEMDFWIYMNRTDCKRFESGCENIVISGCGMTFSLMLSVREQY